MFLQNGRWNGEQIVPKGWAIESTKSQAKTAPGARQYGYQWWIPGDSSGDVEFYAHGIYGQYIYVNRSHNVVIALNSADRRFREEGREKADIDMMRHIAEGL
jgi:CubicO group peptidase (beta-lactamase class C family)